MLGDTYNAKNNASIIYLGLAQTLPPSALPHGAPAGDLLTAVALPAIVLHHLSAVATTSVVRRRLLQGSCTSMAKILQ